MTTHILLAYLLGTMGTEFWDKGTMPRSWGDALRTVGTIFHHLLVGITMSGIANQVFDRLRAGSHPARAETKQARIVVG